MTKKTIRLRVSELKGTGIVSENGSFLRVTASSATARVEFGSVRIRGPDAAAASVNAPQKKNIAQAHRSLCTLLKMHGGRRFFIKYRSL
jgi:hypothetical protein